MFTSIANFIYLKFTSFLCFYLYSEFYLLKWLRLFNLFFFNLMIIIEWKRILWCLFYYCLNWDSRNLILILLHHISWNTLIILVEILLWWNILIINWLIFIKLILFIFTKFIKIFIFSILNDLGVIFINQVTFHVFLYHFMCILIFYHWVYYYSIFINFPLLLYFECRSNLFGCC